MTIQGPGFTAGTVQGLDQLRRKQDKLIKMVAADAVVKMLDKAVQPVEERAKQLAPVRTGDLKRSIKRESAVDGGKAVAVVGTNIAYGRRIELGFVGLDSLGRRYNQSGKPYLFPAARMEQDNVVKKMGSQTVEQIRVIAGNAAAL